MSGGPQPRSDIPLASAEKLAFSGMTNAEMCQRSRKIGTELAKSNILLVNLNDSTITISQYDRTIRLIREIYQSAGWEGKLP
jgi:hypothetical protein